MAKRGMSLLFALMDILIAIVAIYGILAIVNSYASEEYFTKQYIADDMALTLDTALAAPNEIQIDYNKNTSDYELAIDNKGVKVANAYSGYAGEENTKPFDIEKGVPLRIIKDSTGITISKQSEAKQPHIQRLSCQELTPKEILFDPLYGGKEKGELIKGKYQALINREIAYGAYLAADKNKITYTRPLDSPMDSKQIVDIKTRSSKAEQAELVIGFNHGKQAETIIYLKDNAAAQVACHIINSLYESFPETTHSIQYIDEDEFDEDSEFYLLHTKTDAIIISTGQDDYPRLGNAIGKALR